MLLEVSVLVVATTVLLAIYLLKSRWRSRQLKHAAIVEEEERTLDLVAGEIHDHINYKLTLALIKLRDLNISDTREAAELIAQGIEELVQLSRSMNRQLIAQLELTEALRRECARCERLSSIPIQLNIQGEAVYMDPKRELMIYRLLQETLQNTIKHAGAKGIQVVLKFDKDELTLKVSDDGCGYTGLERSGAGMINMQNRARTIQARLIRNSLPSIGTETILITPYHEYKQRMYRYRIGG